MQFGIFVWWQYISTSANVDLIVAYLLDSGV